MNERKNIEELNYLCDQISKTSDKDIIIENVQQLYDLLDEFKNKNIEFSEEELESIKQTMQESFTSIVDKNILTKQQIIQPINILNSIDIVDVNFNGSKISSKLINIGLVGLLMSCSSMFADVVKNQNNYNSNSSRLLLNTSDTQITKYAIPLLKYFQGTVRGNVYNENGQIVQKNVHVVYDDNKGKKKATPWDGKSDLNTFIQNCNGKATIGYGITNPQIVKRGFLTDNQAISYLNSELTKRISQYKQFVGRQVIQSLTYIQQACLMSLWYNIPPYKTPDCVKYLRFAYNSKLDKSNKKLTRNQYLKLAARQFLDCNKSGGKVSKGLTRKVNALHQLFVSSIK